MPCYHGGKIAGMAPSDDYRHRLILDLDVDPGPKPPSERGWNAPWWPAGPHPIGVNLNTGTLLFNQPVVEAFSRDRDVDRTFENEVRPK